MKAFELDLVARHEGKPERVLDKPEVAFRVNDTCYYIVRYDEKSQNIEVYKAGFADDRLTVIVEGANKIHIY